MHEVNIAELDIIGEEKLKQDSITSNLLRILDEFEKKLSQFHGFTERMKKYFEKIMALDQVGIYS